MNTLLQNAADAITQKAGWPPVQADSDGRYRFSLEGGLDFEMFTPDGKTGFFVSELAAVPALSSAQAADKLERIAALSAGVLKKRLSVLSISDSDKFELSRSFSLSESSELEILTHAKEFLNDLAWWKKQMGNEKTSAGTAPAGGPFSFTMGSWFPG